uniref:Laminin subunit alpha 3 n=1 Tax=Salvator merianae TaxID=96440 RepID=A0A8D0C8K4_SALMN
GPSYGKSNGLYNGRCVACNCNGNAHRCLDGSGICINCQHNTAGDNCERCKEGYFGDARQGNCRVCRCPYTNSFATGCVENGGDIQCFCKEGYTGLHCESCAPGYYGNPLKYGGYCQKCNCFDNGQLASCDRLTGECLSQEPRDTDPHEDCDSCDSCVITLLKDLRTMGDELHLIKSQMQNINASTHIQTQMKHLEDRANQLKILLSRYRSTITSQGLKVDEIETDLWTSNIRNWINAGIYWSLKRLCICFFFLTVVLLQQISGTSGEGTLPPGDAAKELLRAQQMINEMRNHSFEQQLIEANKEKGEAQLLLERVRSELQKHQAGNQGLIKIIRDSLNEYESKLKDLQESLKEANEQTKQAENLNRDNKLHLEEIKKRAEEMMKQQNDISNNLRSAGASLSQTNSLFELLQKSKEEYEKLAAQLDGARTDLNEKLRSHSLSASKEPLVVRAEQHASFLQELASKLKNITKNIKNDELVTCAIEAATAYGNIINAIKAAEAAANRAASAADSALTVRRESKHCYDYSLCVLCLLTGDIDTMLTSAKNMVNSANNITSNILDELNPIKEDLEKIKGSNGTAHSVDFNKALEDANNSVMKFTNILPDLFNKITSINEQLMPIGNVSENIDRIRELIQQARDAANKVTIPMRFNGSSGVEVRPPDILDDLKGYTSLSLFLQRPLSRLDSAQTSNMFVMYLGDKDSSKNYIGMAVRGGRLICAYSLGGNEAEVEVSEPVLESETGEATLDLVRFERIYQYAQLNYIKGATSSSPVNLKPLEFDSGSSQTLLNLDPDNVVFYVGGYPDDFKPPRVLEYPNYKGCIELDSLNERVISLYNFKRSFKLNTNEVQPCRRYREQSAAMYFEGTGYAHIVAPAGNRPAVTYEQVIQTTTDEGLIFFAEKQDKFISLRIENGLLVLRYKVDSQPPKDYETQVTVNNGMAHRVSLIINANFIRLLPQTPPLNISTFHFDSYYLGGIPTSLRERFKISTPPFRGCMKNWQTSFAASLTFSDTLGVSRKCPEDWKVIFRVQLPDNDSTVVSTFERKTLNQPIQFGGSDFEGCISNIFIQRYILLFDCYIFFLYFFNSRSHFAVDIRTSSPRGMIFFMGDKAENKYTVLYLSKGRFVFLLVNDGRKIKIKSKAKYSDGQWHTVAFGRTGKKVRLVVDGLKAQEGNIPPSFSNSIESPIYLGGVPSLKVQNIPRMSFVGCLRNFNVGGKLVRSYHQNNGVLPCLDNRLENGVSFFNDGGHMAIEKSFLKGLEYKIAFSIRPRRVTGILIHTGRKAVNYLTVYMEGGKVGLTASGNNGGGEFSTSVTPQQSLCDGKWHFISGIELCHLLMHLPNIDAFLGCLKDVAINDKPVLLSKISDVHGTVSLQGCPVN